MSCVEDDLIFFFCKINVSKNCNIIQEIYSSDVYLSTHKYIFGALISHFKNLFNSSHTPSSHRLNQGKFIPYYLYVRLSTPICDEQIKQVLEGSPSNASLGLDDYTFEFYKHSWSIIGVSLCEIIKYFSLTLNLSNFAKTGISLILKKAHASQILGYRPVSLCNYFYKIIIKVITNRLKKIHSLYHSFHYD